MYASFLEALPVAASWVQGDFSQCRLANYAVVARSVYALIFLSSLLVLERILSRGNTLKYIPMPARSSWLWGHEQEVWGKSVGDAYTEWIRLLGCLVFKIKGALYKSDLLVLADPLAVTHMQKNIYNFAHSEVIRPRIARLLGKSLGWVEGESEHQRMRQLIAPALSLGNIKKGTNQILAASDTFHATFLKHIQSNDGDAIVNIMQWTNLVTIDVIGRFAFDYDFGGGQNTEADQITGAWRSMAQAGIKESGIYALMLLRRFPLLNSLPIKAVATQGSVRTTIHHIAQRLAQRDKELDRTTDRTDLLSRLMIAYNEKKIDLDELLDHILMFIIAGSETTSLTLGFAVWELARAPAIQDRLREEILSMPAEMSSDDIFSTMPYLDAILKETLRLHPGVPYMERVALNDTVLPLRFPIQSTNGNVLTEIPIKAGQTIITPIHSINRLDSVWGDGHAFRPQRWLSQLPNADLLSGGWGGTLAFSAGPRSCVGFRLAIYEFKIILFMLIKHFKFHDTGAEIVYKVTSSVQPIVVGKEGSSPCLPVRVTLV